MGLRTTSPLFKSAGDLAVRERDWNFFKASSPGNLKMMELLYLQDRENDVLQQSLIKGFAGYAFGVSETLALEDELMGVENSEHRLEAISMYTRSFDYGLDYLERRGIKRKKILSMTDDDLNRNLEEYLTEKDHAALLFTAQSWGSLINLQKDNMVLVSQVPKVKLIFDWVCEKNPDIENGICDIFFAQYEGSRPRMLGGNPEKARVLYQAAIRKSPKNLLIRLGQIQYLILPTLEAEEYEKEAEILRSALAGWSDLNRDDLENKSLYQAHEDLNLFNAIAKKRFEIIERHKSKIF
jgi:hypothetical protein